MFGLAPRNPPDLRQGATGQYVKFVQDALAVIGYYNAGTKYSDPEGVFDYWTATAVLNFNLNRFKRDTSVVDKAVWDALSPVMVVPPEMADAPVTETPVANMNTAKVDVIGTPYAPSGVFTPEPGAKPAVVVNTPVLAVQKDAEPAAKKFPWGTVGSVGAGLALLKFLL